MRQRNFVTARVLALFLGVLLGGLPAYAASAGGGYPGYRTVAGDFNGDGWTDFVLQPLPGYHGTAEFLAYDDGNFGPSAATWPDQSLGTDWNAGAHRIVVGDYNGDGRDDLILQGAAGLASQQYLTAADGRFSALPRTLPATLGGLELSQASHDLVVGDFNGDGRADLLLQAGTFVGTNGIAPAGADGKFDGLATNWDDGTLGLAWSADRAALSAGDFNGDGRAELLVRAANASAASGACCRIVAFDPSESPKKIVQSWNADYLGVNWEPATHRAIGGDFNGDGRDDLLIQPDAPGDDIFVLLADRDGKFTAIADRWPSERDGVDWSAESYLLVPEPAAPGHGATLAMIPQQLGLPYRRAHFDTFGHLTGLTALTGPPADALAVLGGTGGGPGAGGDDGISVTAHPAGGHEMAPNDIVDADTAGAMDGSAGVANGTATYSIPIAVPPGRAGMAPSLSLGYSSSGGDGHEGVGWSLGGLSAIYRCPATFASDGVTRGTTFTSGNSGDRFCLDGQKLMVTSGTYGAAGSVYHAEVNGFAKVAAVGSQGNGPQSFTVTTPDGNKLYYGSAAESRLLKAPGDGNSSVFTWALEKSVDADGNEVDYHYHNAGGEYYPSEIDYTLHDGGQAGAPRKVVFGWDDRGSIGGAANLVHYLAGMKLQTMQILTGVDTYVGGTHVRSYALDYHKSPATSRPLLDSVQECAWDNAGKHCLPAATFDYQGQHAPQFVSVNPEPLNLSDPTPKCTMDANMPYAQPYDMDGDGLGDLTYFTQFRLQPLTYSIQYGQADGFEAPEQTTSGRALGVAIDFNLDGRTDFMKLKDEGDSWKVSIDYTTGDRNHYYTNDTDVIYPKSPGHNLHDYHNNGFGYPLVADVNGDGKPDFITYWNTRNPDKDHIQIWLAQGTGNDTHYSAGATFDTDTNQWIYSAQAFDYDADGRSDLLIRYKNADHYTLLHSENNPSEGDHFSEIQTNLPVVPAFSYGQPTSDAAPIVFADVNGDSLPDVLGAAKSGAQWHWVIYPNTGNANGQFDDTENTDIDIAATADGYPFYNFLRTLSEPNGRTDLLVPTARTYFADEIGQCNPYDPDDCGGYFVHAGSCSGKNFRTDQSPSPRDGYDWRLYRANGTAFDFAYSEITFDNLGTGPLIDFNHDGLPDVVGASLHVDQDAPYDEQFTRVSKAYQLSYAGSGGDGAMPDLLAKSDSGFGIVNNFSYKPTVVDSADPGFYTRETGDDGNYPDMLFASTMMVVSSMTETNPTGSTNQYDYSYYDARYNVAGRGFLGFATIDVKDERRGTETVTAYDHDFPYIGRIASVTTSTIANVNTAHWLSQTTTDWRSFTPSGADYKVVYAHNQSAKTQEPATGYSPIETVSQTQNQPDACGNPGHATQTTDTQQATQSVTTDTTYNDGDPDSCWQDTVHTQTATNALSYTKAPTTNDTLTVTSTYTYWPDSKVKTKHVMAPHGGENQPRDWSYAYDDYGNPVSVTQSADGEDRTTTSDYSAGDGYFPGTVTNALGQTTTFAYAPATGNKTSARDPNGIETDYAYHAFGRSAGGHAPGASAVAIHYFDPGGDYACPGTAQYVAVRTQAGHPESYTCTDAFGHEVRTATQGFDGNWIYVNTGHDALGRVVGKSAPYFAGGTIYTTHYLDYDVLDRPAEVDYPVGRETDMAYAGLATTFSDKAGGVTHIYTHRYDGLGKGNGRLAEVDDAAGAATYRYDAGGNLMRATDPMGNHIIATYDGFGDKLTLDDPDKGQWGYGYDGFGEQTTVTNARGKTITTDYDTLGRKTVEHDPADAGGRQSTWTYDTADHGIGQVASETVQENVNAGGDPAVTVYQRLYAYDTAGRATASEITVGGATYLEGTGYDDDGRPAVQAYPALGGGEDQPPTVDPEVDPPGPVATGSAVGLIASGSDPDGWGLSYHWEQTGGGPAATLTDTDQAHATASLPQAGTYHFQVTASDGFHQATASVSVSAADPPSGTPTLSLDPETSHSGGYAVSWTAVEGATSYRLQESQDGGNWTQKYNDSGRSWQASGRDIGSYRYQVQACSAPEVCGAWSARVTETVAAPSPPAAPTATPQTSYEGSFEVDWNDVAGATSYTLKERETGGPGDPTYDYYNDLSVSHKSVTGREAGTYTYWVKSCSAVGCGSYGAASTAVEALAPPPPSPPTVGPNPSYSGHYTVSWGSAAGADTYDLDEQHGGSWSEHDDLTTHQWATSKTSTGTWTYMVRGCDTFTGCGDWSGIRDETVSAPPRPAPPTFNHNPSHNGSYTVHWDDVSGADWYDLNEKHGGSWSAHNNLNTIQWATSQPDNGTWSYEVRACNSVTDCGAWSEIRDETVAYIPATPTGFHRAPIQVYPNSLYTLSWDGMAHASSYDLARDGTGVTQGGITATHKDETAPGQPDTTVTWRVRACGAGGCSNWSAPLAVYITPRPGQPPPCPPLSPDCQPKAPQPHAPRPHTVSDGGTGALIVTTAYNAAGYATTLTRGADGRVYGTIQTMDAWGHATIITEANGVTVTRGYSQVTGLALSLQAANGSATLAQYTYTWDGYGNLDTREDVLNGGTETEHYDDLNRLKQSILALAGGGGGTTTYDYDPAGNLTSRSDRGTYTYGENDAGPHAVTSITDGSSFSYNENGEMSADNGKTLTWATFGQAIEISQASTDVSLAYDAENQRYEKTVATNSGTETVFYLGAAERLTVNGQTSIRRTLTLADLTVIDTGGNNAGLLFPVSDHLGSTIVLGDGNGASAQAMSYGPFGTRMTAGWAGAMSISQALTINQTESDRGYTGQEGLDAVALWDYNARLYDPALGRFLSVDPLIAHPESTQGINPYSYVENNPLNKTDPTGEAGALAGVGECTSTGGNSGMCTPLGSHIPEPTSVNPTTGAVSGALAGTNGHSIALSTDYRSTVTFTPSGSALQGQGTTGANGTGNTNVSAHNYSGQQPASAGGDKQYESYEQLEKNMGGGRLVAANDDVGKQLFNDHQFHQFSDPSALAAWMGPDAVVIGIRGLYIPHLYPLKLPIVPAPPFSPTDGLYHEQLFYTRSKGHVFNSGYFKGTGVGPDPHFPDNIEDYLFIPIGHDIPLNLHPSGFTPNNYNIILHNCQNYICHVFTPDSGGQ